MDLELYFKRINYTGTPRVDLQTLSELHRLHLLNIPYENLDIHLGHKIALDEGAFFEKLVKQKRGGWCYEMNGLFSMVLRELGFKIHLLAGSVRKVSQEPPTGDHLVLLVELDRPYVVDVGFGDGFLEPLPLEEGTYTQGHLTFRLEREGDYWVVHNHPDGGAKRYDFKLTPWRLEQFQDRCHELQTSPASGFVRTAVCQRITPESIFVLRGANFKKISRGEPEERVIENAAEYREVLAEYFRLDLEDISGLWPRVWSSHQEWVKQKQAS